MFDVNPLATKCYLKDLERQVAAARRPQGIPLVRAQSAARAIGSERLAGLYRDVPARALASAMRGLAALIL